MFKERSVAAVDACPKEHSEYRVVSVKGDSVSALSGVMADVPHRESGWAAVETVRLAGRAVFVSITLVGSGNTSICSLSVEKVSVFLRSSGSIVAASFPTTNARRADKSPFPCK